MLRLMYYFCIIFLVICSFIGVSNSPKNISIIWENQIYQTNSLVVLSLIYILIFAFIVISSMSKFFLSWPSLLISIFHKRNHHKGYKSLSTGLIAIASNNKHLARKMSSYASQYLASKNNPLVHVLESQVALLSKEYSTAREKFEMMLQIPDTREFALYGLYRESCRIGDLKSAKCYAEKALKIFPNPLWCVESILYDYISEKEWSKAINFIDKQKYNDNVSKYNQYKSILLIARSLENLSTNNAINAYTDAINSLKLCSNSIMASISAAKALIYLGKIRKAELILEKIWATNPHPEIAHIYTKLLSKNTTERLKRALRLEAINKNNVESLIIVAKVALQEGDINLARKKAMHAIKTNPRKEIYLIIAGIERLNDNNLDQVLYWTEKASNAMPDPLWIAEDGFLSPQWLPTSPISNKIYNFEWKIPTKSPEYISYQYLEKSLNSDKEEKKIQKCVQQQNEKQITTIYQKSNYPNQYITSLNTLIKQPDDPGVTEKHTWE